MGALYLSSLPRLKELKVFHIISDVHGTNVLLFARVLHSDSEATGFGIKIFLTHILVIKFDGSFYR